MRKLLSVVLVVLLAVGVPAKAQAVSSVKSEYSRILSNKKVAEKVTGWRFRKDAEFALIDINKDGISELICTPDSMNHTFVIAYVNGKAKVVGNSYVDGGTYYPDKHLYFTATTRTGIDKYAYYRFTGKKMKLVAEMYGDDTYNAITGKKKSGDSIYTFKPYRYTVEGKIVSAKKYKAYVKKLLSGAKSVEPKWYKNTAANRRKYLEG